MDGLQVFGLVSLASGLVFYALEERFRWAVLCFALACALGAVYGFLLPDAWPFGLVEGAWALVAMKKWAGWKTQSA